MLYAFIDPAEKPMKDTVLCTDHKDKAEMVKPFHNSDIKDFKPFTTEDPQLHCIVCGKKG